MHRRARNHSIVVVAMFAALLGLGAWGQHRTLQRLRSDARIVEQQYAQAQQHAAHLAALQEELAQVTKEADLLAYLDHPWPRSQVLRAIAGPLPPELVASRIYVLREQRPTPKQSNTAPQSSTQTTAQTTVLAEADLKKLRDEIESTHLVVSIEGVTRDHAALHIYLHELTQHSLIPKAELVSLERSSKDGDETRFVAKAWVAAAYGQPGHTPPSEAVMAVASRKEQR